MGIGAGLRRKSSAGVILVMALVGFLLFPTAAMGATTIEVPIDSDARGPNDSVHLLATIVVEANLVGAQCTAFVDTQNQTSVHPDSDIIVDSGGTQVVVLDVERESFGVIHGQGTLTLGDTVTVSVRLGEDGRFSGGLTLTIDCESPPATTVPPDVSATTAETTSSTQATTSTTEVSPTVSGIVVTGPSNPQVGGTASTLPFTGMTNASLAVTGAGMVALGVLLATLSRRGDDRSAPRTWS